MERFLFEKYIWELKEDEYLIGMFLVSYSSLTGIGIFCETL